MNTTSSKLDVIKAGEEALTCVYGGLSLEGLDIFRWRKFTAKAITGNTFTILFAIASNYI
jgi:hypothetical protein